MLKELKEKYSKTTFAKKIAPAILSVIFAIIFWAFVMEEVNPSIKKEFSNVSVELRGVETLKSNNFVIIGDTKFYSDVEVTGRRNAIKNLDEEDIKLYADVSDVKKGENIILISKNISDEELQLDVISNENIVLEVDRVLRKPITVFVETKGSPPEDYIFNKTELSKNEVFVKGPERYIEEVDKLKGYVSIEKETSNFSREVAIEAVDKNDEVVNNIEIENEYVSVEVKINKIVSVPIVERIIGEPKKGYDIYKTTLSTDEVQIIGEKEIVDELKFIYTEDIDISGVDKDIKYKTSLEIPPELEIYHSKKDIEVDLSIKELVSKIYKIDTDNINIINKDDDIKNIEIVEIEEIEAEITDFEDIIDGIKVSDINLYIDASDLKKDIQLAEVFINGGVSYKKVDIIPKNVKVKTYSD